MTPHLQPPLGRGKGENGVNHAWRLNFPNFLAEINLGSISKETDNQPAENQADLFSGVSRDKINKHWKTKMELSYLRENWKIFALKKKIHFHKVNTAQETPLFPSGHRWLRFFVPLTHSFGVSDFIVIGCNILHLYSVLFWRTVYVFSITISVTTFFFRISSTWYIRKLLKRRIFFAGICVG